MKYSIENYITAIVAGNFAGELEGVSTPLDHLGRPTFMVDRNCITFVVRQCGELKLLTIPFNVDGPQLAEIVYRTKQAGKYCFMSGKRFITDGVVVHDNSGTPHLYHALIEPYHTNSHTFVRQNHSPQRKHLLRRAIESIAEASQQIKAEGLNFGFTAMEHTHFDTRGRVYITTYPLGTNGSPYYTYQILASAVMALYIGASELEAYKILHSCAYTHEKVVSHLRILASAAEHYGISSIAHLAKAVLNKATPDDIVSAIEDVAVEPFRPMPLLLNMLAPSVAPQVNVISPPPQPEPIRVSPELFDEVCPSSEMIRRAYRDGHWYYLTLDNRVIPTERPLVAAFDFYEGRAVVRTERGYGLIDRHGGWVMRDRWSDIAWHGSENIVTASDGGIWHIYNRSGQQLSTIGAEWMGDAGEGFVIGRRGNKYAYYSTSGKLLGDFMYDQAGSFNDGVALVERRGSRYYIDTTLHKLSAHEQEKVLARNKTK